MDIINIRIPEEYAEYIRNYKPNDRYYELMNRDIFYVAMYKSVYNDLADYLSVSMETVVGRLSNLYREDCSIDIKVDDAIEFYSKFNSTSLVAIPRTVKDDITGKPIMLVTFDIKIKDGEDIVEGDQPTSYPHNVISINTPLTYLSFMQNYVLSYRDQKLIRSRKFFVLKESDYIRAEWFLDDANAEEVQKKAIGRLIGINSKSGIIKIEVDDLDAFYANFNSTTLIATPKIIRLGFTKIGDINPPIMALITFVISEYREIAREESDDLDSEDTTV